MTPYTIEHQPAPFETHEVINQVPPLEETNFLANDRPLLEGLRREGAGWAEASVLDLAASLAGEPFEWGNQANLYPPVLHTHDRRGVRIDRVEFHPAWHDLMSMSVRHGIHCLPWTDPRPGAHVARAALFMTMAQVEPGHGCPISMTSAIVPALRAQPDVADEWMPLIASRTYDGRTVPAHEKDGVICGMALTEKQGGSDVRANTTRAHPTGEGGPGAEYELTGHKWFVSAVMSDVFLTLAQTDDGLTCFLMPRLTPDGQTNGFHIQRLKDKMGNRSNATAEVELRSSLARMVGEPGRGVPTIIEMVNHTRLDCMLGSASGMRFGTAQAIHHASHRSAFGKVVIDHPLMANVLADLAIESEAATMAALRVARAYDGDADDAEAAFKRLATAVMKYWICKRAPWHAAESLECLGGGGYIEESGMPRLFRESPLQSIWEGSGNVICLDVLRAMARTPESVDAFFGEVDLAAGADGRLDSFVSKTKAQFGDIDTIESRARRLVESMALALQGSLLVRFGDPAVADAFCASRLSGDRAGAFGTLPPGLDLGRIIDRNAPSEH